MEYYSIQLPTRVTFEVKVLSPKIHNFLIKFSKRYVMITTNYNKFVAVFCTGKGKQSEFQ